MRCNRRRDIIVSATKVRLQCRVLLILPFSNKIVASPNTTSKLAGQGQLAISVYGAVKLRGYNLCKVFKQY